MIDDVPNEAPRFSVIIPAYNAAAVLERCLAALAASTFRDYECLVVDDASTDNTRSIAEQCGVRVIALAHNRGPASARNHAARDARGEILVFIDADVCVHAPTLARVDTHFRAAPDAVAVMGSYDDTPADAGFVSQYKNLFHHYIHQQSRTDAWTFWAGCGAVRRDVFLRFGGFDESYRRPCIEDIELGFRLKAAGHRIDLDRAIQATHLKQWTLPTLIRTDVYDRGVPWLLLMLRHRTMPPDLNVTVAHRASVVLSALCFVVLLLGAALPVLDAWSWQRSALYFLPPLGMGLALLLVLNRRLYAFFARKRGLRFALAATVLHWFYYLCCGVAVALALVLAARREGAAAPA